MNMETPKLTEILQEKKWTSFDSISMMKKLSAKLKDDLCMIFLDARNQEPEVLKVSGDVFQGKVYSTINFTKISELKSVIDTLLIESDHEFMACLRQSQIDKKNGRTRKYEDIARECGLRI
jgi:hypothetical protein